VLLDDTKLRRLLGEVRKTPYAEGIQRTVEAMKSSP
jgi:nucleoside-diphosphate-sugar epimerase